MPTWALEGKSNYILKEYSQFKGRQILMLYKLIGQRFLKQKGTCPFPRNFRKSWVSNSFMSQTPAKSFQNRSCNWILSDFFISSSLHTMILVTQLVMLKRQNKPSAPWPPWKPKWSHLGKPRANIFASKTFSACEPLKNFSIFNGQKYLPAKL